jgi:hypothetical protein
MLDQAALMIELVPEGLANTNLETDEAWQEECRDLFLDVQDTFLAQGIQVTIEPQSIVEPGTKDTSFVFSSLLILLPNQ